MMYAKLDPLRTSVLSEQGCDSGPESLVPLRVATERERVWRVYIVPMPSIILPSIFLAEKGLQNSLSVVKYLQRHLQYFTDFSGK